jgi:hypothetical protein
MAQSTNKVLSRSISSIGFSGAGFLASYHLGAAQCLIDHGFYDKNRRGKDQIPLIGVSGGALTIAAISAGVNCSDGMAVCLDVSRQARQSNLDILRPGFSMLDVMENHLTRLLHDAIDGDEESYLQQIEYGQLLRIGLTDRRSFFASTPPAVVGQMAGRNAWLYVDRYRSVGDIIAACVLSSYIPGITGPALGSMALKNTSVARASEKLKEMVASGCVKKGWNGEIFVQDDANNQNTTTTTTIPSNDTNTGLSPEQTSISWREAAAEKWMQYYNKSVEGREWFWDGGLVNAFPFIDDDTLIVSPIAAKFTYNDSITPILGYRTDNNICSVDDENHINFIKLDSRVSVQVTTENARVLRCITFSSEDSVLEQKFSQGYDNAHQYLKQNNLLSVFHTQQPSRATNTLHRQ